MSIFKKNWVLILLLLPFLKPRYFSSILLLDSIFDFWKIASAFLILILYFFHNKLSKLILYIGLFSLSWLISTIINSGNYFKFFADCGSILFMCMLVEMFIVNNPKNALKVISRILFVLVFINLLSIFFPQLMGLQELVKSNVYFLGYDNYAAFLLIPTIGISMVFSYSKFNRMSIISYFTIIIVIVSFFYTWSVAAIIGVIVLLITLIYTSIKKNTIFNFYTYFIIAFTMFLLVVVLRVQNYFAYFIEDILNKNLTLTGRTYIWDKTINYISQAWILGYGYESLSLTTVKLSIDHPHNIFLQLFYQTGIVGTVLYIKILMMCGKKLFIFRKNIMSKIISATIFAQLIIMQADAYLTSPVFYILIVLGYHLDKLLIFEKDV